jgi:hypothetical protein
MMLATLVPIRPVPGLPPSTPPVPDIVADARTSDWNDAIDSPWHGGRDAVVVAVDPEEDEDDIGDEEDLAVTQPTGDDESSFDDFDDEFDDDFEEEENDPDWDHPDDGDSEPPPGKAPGRKK